MAEIATQPDGTTQIAVSAAEAAGLRGIAAIHLPFLVRAQHWFSADIAPEITDAADFLKSLTSAPAGGSTLTVTASQVQSLRGLLSAHIPDFRGVLAVVESPAVRSMLNFAEALL